MKKEMEKDGLGTEWGLGDEGTGERGERGREMWVAVVWLR